MAAGPFVLPDKAKLNRVAIGLLAQSSGYKLALVASLWVPNPTTLEVFADVTGELATGNGYTAGGIALTGAALTGSPVKFTSANAVWTASGTGIPAWRYAVLYYAGTLSGKVNPIVAYALADATPADFPLTASGNTITFTPNGLGIVGDS